MPWGCRQGGVWGAGRGSGAGTVSCVEGLVRSGAGIAGQVANLRGTCRTGAAATPVRTYQVRVMLAAAQCTHAAAESTAAAQLSTNRCLCGGRFGTLTRVTPVGCSYLIMAPHLAFGPNGYRWWWRGVYGDQRVHLGWRWRSWPLAAHPRSAWLLVKRTGRQEIVTLCH